MKKVQMIVTYTVTDEFYESDIKVMEEEISTGEFQKDMMKSQREGIKKCRVTMKVTKEW